MFGKKNKEKGCGKCMSKDLSNANTSNSASDCGAKLSNKTSGSRSPKFCSNKSVSNTKSCSAKAKSMSNTTKSCN